MPTFYKIKFFYLFSQPIKKLNGQSYFKTLPPILPQTNAFIKEKKSFEGKLCANQCFFSFPVYFSAGAHDKGTLLGKRRSSEFFLEGQHGKLHTVLQATRRPRELTLRKRRLG